MPDTTTEHDRRNTNLISYIENDTNRPFVCQRILKLTTNDNIKNILYSKMTNWLLTHVKYNVLFYNSEISVLMEH